MRKRRKQQSGQKKKSVGTKLYPNQIAYIDALAYQKKVSRYTVIYEALKFALGFED